MIISFSFDFVNKMNRISKKLAAAINQEQTNSNTEDRMRISAL